MKLQDKIAIVTGPAKGMGADITLSLARAGAHLVLAGRDLAAIAPVAAQVEALGRRALVVGCDVTDEQQVAALAAAALAQFGRIDILVNCAGGTGTIEKPGHQNSVAEFEQILDLNMKGCWLTMRAVIPAMIAQRYGKIVNVGGTFGMRGRAGRMAYSASKWGLRGITKSTAIEVGPHNVNVNYVAPGMVEGERFNTKVLPEKAKKLGLSIDQARKTFENEYALRRISTGQDIANAVLFLASDLSRQITGVDLPVDGGWAEL
jgi:3-oxoacyl-[acyl-carrier protein] reductase